MGKIMDRIGVERTVLMLGATYLVIMSDRLFCVLRDKFLEFSFGEFVLGMCEARSCISRGKVGPTVG